MKIVFLGTPDFAVPALKAVAESGNEIAAVVTQPDAKVGRKQVLTPSAVKAEALSLGLKTLFFEKISAEGLDILKSIAPDMMITCAYGQILSKDILGVPKYGTFNIHASLLPKYRGASPIQAAILNGESETGITIMKTDVGVDTGDIFLQKKVAIAPEETAGELFERLSELGAECIKEFLASFSPNRQGEKQDEKQANYTKMIKKQDGALDFSKTPGEIINCVRAMNPWPAAYFMLSGEIIKVFQAEEYVSNKAAPNIHNKEVVCENDAFGKILFADAKNGLVVSCKGGAVRLTTVQRAGGKKMSDAEYLRGIKTPLTGLYCE